MKNAAICIRTAIVGLLTVHTIALAPSASSADTTGPQAAGSISPDGKWEFRLATADEKQDSDTVFVIAKRGSQERSVALTEEAFGTFADNARIIWAPDSKRFAFNYQPGLRVHAVQFFQLEGDEWRELGSPETDDAVTAPIARSMAAQRKKLKLSPKKTGRLISDGCKVRRWIGPDTALLYAFSDETFQIKNELEQVGDECFVTLKFDATGEWKVVRTRMLPEKGIAGLTKEEREELARLQTGSEEGD